MPGRWCSEDSPRILGAFNEETPDWLSFFMFTYFTDRDGKYQLGTLKESAFDLDWRWPEPQRAGEERPRCGGVAAGPDQHVDQLGVLIDGAVAVGPAAGDP